MLKANAFLKTTFSLNSASCLPCDPYKLRAHNCRSVTHLFQSLGAKSGRLFRRLEYRLCEFFPCTHIPIKTVRRKDCISRRSWAYISFQYLAVVKLYSKRKSRTSSKPFWLSVSVMSRFQLVWNHIHQFWRRLEKFRQGQLRLTHLYHRFVESSARPCLSRWMDWLLWHENRGYQLHPTVSTLPVLRPSN